MHIKGGVDMTEFGRWLGKENGKELLRAVFSDCSKEQARAAVTTYCMIFGIQVDTKEWDDLMDWIWIYYDSWFEENDFEGFEMYMSELLV